MAWTAPRTWVTAEIVTASVMNTHVRDNLLETAPGIATTAGRILVVGGANSVVERLADGANITTSETTTSTSFTDLTTTGPTVSSTTGTRAIVWLGCQISNNTAGEWGGMSFAISGATTSSAGSNTAIMFESDSANQFAHVGSSPFEVTLTSGTNTFTSKYIVSGGTGTFLRRRIFVLAL